MTIGIMEVVLMGARGLKNTDHFFGKIDPYVVIQYKNQEHSSRTARVLISLLMSIKLNDIGQGSKPLWNEKFSFRVEYPASKVLGEDNEKYKLFLQIMDSDTFTHDDDLGQTMYEKTDEQEYGGWKESQVDY
ncbi:hypothetical protein BUALT_Bualt01G0127500 [Buddleja alternifolia]|uniref:C2 domain-containing protein n=1 Tax=Buddleja alternifolia TaxID=168488 RepID=A0AAV6YDM3_9LAMI|nr:hypothetical protein BUALT_Bualt01G0127500 [Buddleja alternifolia]